MRGVLLPLLMLAGMAGGALRPAGLWAQVEGELGGSSRVCGYRVSEGGVTRREGQLVHIDDPFQVTCDDGARVRAERGTVDQTTRVVSLFGSVYFEDATRTLSSDQATYDANQGVLHANGNVDFTDRVEGTTLTGPELEYYRATAERPEALVNAYGRPRLTLSRTPRREAEPEAGPELQPGVEDTVPQEDGAPADTSGMPLTIDADRMTIEGQNDLTAVGSVVIQDDGMRAVADEAEQRGSSETLELRGGAEIHSREYSLAADTIYATVPEGSLRDVQATGHARLLGQDLDVDAPRLDLAFQDDLLQRSIARSDEALAPGVQPLASSPTFRLQADSIDASLPGQRLQVVVAVGNARGEMIDTTRAAVAPADSLAAAPGDSVTAALADAMAEPAPGIGARFESGDSVTTLSGEELVATDWITGDTITGYFASVVRTPGDSAAAAAAGEPGEDELVDAASAVDPGLQQADTALVMERLVAVGWARSLYHVAPEEGSPPGTKPGINFLSAAHIELRFADGQVQVANVTGLRRGLYLEPLAVASETEGAANGEADAGGGVDPADDDLEAETPAAEADTPAVDPPAQTPPARGDRAGAAAIEGEGANP